MQAITSPQEPATMWPVGVSPLRSGPGGQLNAREKRKKVRRFRARMVHSAPRAHDFLHTLVRAEEEHRAGGRADGPRAEASVHAFGRDRG